MRFAVIGTFTLNMNLSFSGSGKWLSGASIAETWKICGLPRTGRMRWRLWLKEKNESPDWVTIPLPRVTTPNRFSPKDREVSNAGTTCGSDMIIIKHEVTSAIWVWTITLSGRNGGTSIKSGWKLSVTMNNGRQVERPEAAALVAAERGEEGEIILITENNNN